MNIGSCYLEMAQPQKSLVEIDSGVEYYKKYAAAKGEYFDVNICSAMSNRAAILRDIGRHDDALAEINSAINYLNIKKSILLSPKEWQLLCGLYIRASSVYLEIKNADSALFHAKKSLALIENKNSATEHDEIAKSISWTQVANALQMSKHYEQAAEAYGKADFYRSKKIDQSRIIDDSASIYVNWARSLYMANRDEDAIKLFRKSYDWLSKAPSTPSRDHQLFLLVQNWQYCWSTMPDGQGWAREVSAELCRRLSEQNLANPPHKLVELHRRFTQFHLRWMQDSLRDGYPKHIVEILSRFSSWRMATALLDELETIAPAADGEEGSRTLQHYQRTRLEVRRLQQRLQEKEVAAGRSGTDFSGVLGFSLDGSKRSAKAQARLDAEINILRNEYDYVYTEMQQAQAKAALVPGYTALSIDRSSLDSHRLQQSLADKQALLIIFDHETDGDKSESAEKIGGALLLQRDSVHWHPLNDIAMGSAFLHKFEYFVGENRGDLRGSESLRIDYLKKTSVKVESTFYGDFRRGDMPKIDEEEKHDPLVYQGRIINQFNLWNSLGDWVKDVLWNPILQKGLLEGIEELVLVTQGQQSHSIPWQMGTQVKSEAIRRYPGLIFYAMDAGLMSRANCSNEPTLGIAHYQGSNRSLPFARIEAEVLGQIWTKSGRKALQDFDYLNPQLSVGIVHVAGHGSHAPEPNQAATACLSVGKHTNWGLAQLMSSQARPSQVYLSCCVAGRTTDLAGEQYGVTAALLQHGTREVVASSVSLNDLWGATLSIITHSLMRQQGLPMREALHQAQAMVTERQAWDETAWAWVTKGWIMRLDEVMQEYLLPLIRGLQTKSFAMSSDQKLANSLRDKMRIDVYTNIPHINLIKFDDQKRAEWELALARELRTHSGLADESTLMSMVQKYTNTFHQTLTWLTQAPPLITGSLVFATAVFG